MIIASPILICMNEHAFVVVNKHVLIYVLRHINILRKQFEHPPFVIAVKYSLSPYAMSIL